MTPEIALAYFRRHDLTPARCVDPATGRASLLAAIGHKLKRRSRSLDGLWAAVAKHLKRSRHYVEGLDRGWHGATGDHRDGHATKRSLDRAEGIRDGRACAEALLDVEAVARRRAAS